MIPYLDLFIHLVQAANLMAMAWMVTTPLKLFVEPCQTLMLINMKYYPWRIHGAAIYGNIWGILMGSMLP